MFTSYLTGNNDIELVPPDIRSDPWLIRTTRSFDRDVSETDNGTRPDMLNVVIECKLYTHQATSKKISKAFVVYILDEDDNAPKPQEPEIIIQLNNNVVSRVSFSN